MFDKSYFVALIFCFVFVKTNAQEVIYDATLSYSVSVISTNDKEISKLFEGATYKVYLKGSTSKTELKTALGTETSIYDSKENVGAILKEYSNQKLMIPMNQNNWNDKNKIFHELLFKEEVEKTNINGALCKKANSVNTKGDIIVVYYNPDIVLSNKEYNNCFYSLNGVPVKYEQYLKNGTTYIYSLINIDFDIVSLNKFEVPKSGYRVISYDEASKVER